MREDAQLVCPISYDDPDNKWDDVSSLLMQELPLKNVTWKSPISSSFITINSLPLRFLPSTASLFQDTEHAFRWLLAPYVHMYILVAETMDAYKTAKVSVKKWVDLKNNQKSVLGKAPWFIVYLPTGSQGIDTYNKVYYRVCNDFYVDRTGDHSVMLLLPSLIDDGNPANILLRRTSTTTGMLNMASSFSMNLSSHASVSSHGVTQISTTHVNDVLCLLREGIVRSFQQRCALYDNDIRRLDAQRGTNAFDFRQLFLVKESLALMYQMMQLQDMSLAQYEELEAILSYTNMAALPDSDWPMVAAEAVRVSDLANMTQDSRSARESGNFSSANSEKDKEKEKDKDKDAMSDAVKNGDEIVSYSINIARMKILKNKMTKLELHRYVYARQMYFLVQLQRPVQCATNSRTFLLFCYNYLSKKLLSERRGTSNTSSSGNSGTNSSVEEPAIGDEDRDVHLLMQQFYMWMLVASVKVVRVCCDLIHKIYPSQHSAVHDYSQHSLMHYIQMNAHKADGARNTRQAQPETAPSQLDDEASGLGGGVSVSGKEQSLDNKAGILKETYVILAEILCFSVSLLQKLSPILVYTRQYVSSAVHIQRDGYASPTTPSPLLEEFFSLFADESSAGTCALLTQDLDNLRVDKQDNLSNVLVSLSQRLRSVSHYWAKIYSVEKAEFASSDKWQISQDFLSQRKKAGFAPVQIQRGLLLESMVMVLVCEALWELYTQSDRVRFALTYKIQVLMSLYVSKQYRLASVMAHDVLCMNNLMVSDSAPKHIQMWYGLGASPYTHIWPDSMVLLLGILCKMKKKLCLTNAEADTVYTMLPYHRLLAYRLLYVMGLNGSGGLYTQNILDCVKMLTKPRSTASATKEDEKVAEDTIILPLTTFLPYTITYTNASQHTHGNLYIQEDKYVVNMCTYTLNPVQQNTATITIQNPFFIPILQVVVVYKRLHPHLHEDVYGYGVPFTYHHLAYTDIVTNRILLEDITAIQDDEFVCTNLTPNKTNSETKPNICSYSYSLSPHILGEFYVDRVFVVSHNTLFVDKPLLSSTYAHTKYTPPSPAPYTPHTLMSPSKSIHNNSAVYKQSLLINSAGDILPNLVLTHQEVQMYFDIHTIVQFVSGTAEETRGQSQPSTHSPSLPSSPSNTPFLHTTIHTSRLSTYQHADHMLVTLRTSEFERIDNLAITLQVKKILVASDVDHANNNGNGGQLQPASVAVNSQQNHHIIFQPHAGATTPTSPYRRQSSAHPYSLENGDADDQASHGVGLDISAAWKLQLYEDCAYSQLDGKNTVLTRQHDVNGHNGTSVQLLSSIPAARFIAVTIPYTITNNQTQSHTPPPSPVPGNTTTAETHTPGHQVQLEVMCVGNLFQSNCMVPFVMNMPYTLHVHPIMTGQVSAMVVYGGNASVRNVCVFGHASNDSNIVIHIVGYSLRALLNGVWEDVHGESSVCKVLSMGEDLPLLNANGQTHSNHAQTPRVCLLPGEDYHFHVMLETPAQNDAPHMSSKDVSVEVVVRYIRQSPANASYTTLIHEDVCTYTLPYTSTNAPAGSDAIPGLFAPICADLAPYPVHTGATSTSPSPARLLALLAEVLVLSATIRIDTTAPGLWRCEYAVHASEVLDQDDEYKFRLLAKMQSHLDVAMMCVSVYESTQYVPIGLCLRSDTHEEGKIHVQIAIVPTKTGDIHLPPLQVQCLDDHGAERYVCVYEASPASPFTYMRVVDGVAAQSLDRVFSEERAPLQDADV